MLVFTFSVHLDKHQGKVARDPVRMKTNVSKVIHKTVVSFFLSSEIFANLNPLKYR